MGQTEQEPSERRRIPTFLWVVLGLGVVLIFAAAITLLHRPGPPTVYAPPAGSPATQ